MQLMPLMHLDALIPIEYYYIIFHGFSATFESLSMCKLEGF